MASAALRPTTMNTHTALHNNHSSSRLMTPAAQAWILPSSLPVAMPHSLHTKWAMPARPLGTPVKVARTDLQSTASNPESVPAGNLYPGQGFVWEFPAPKPSVTHGEPWFLLVVNFTHYLIFATQLGVAYTVWTHAPALAPHIEAGGSLFLVMMAPVFQALAGTGAVLMHEYEGWQVAPFEGLPLPAEPSPSSSPNAAVGKGSSSPDTAVVNHPDVMPDPRFANSELLRRAAYRSLFTLQAVAAAMSFVGVYGLNHWGPLPAPFPAIITAVLGAALFAAPRNDLLQLPQGLLPVPKLVFAIFVLSVIGYTVSQAHFLGGWTPALIAAGLNAAGGITEGWLAESTFDQRLHFLAVVFLNAGGFFQIWWLATHFAAV